MHVAKAYCDVYQIDIYQYMHWQYNVSERVFFRDSCYFLDTVVRNLWTFVLSDRFY